MKKILGLILILLLGIGTGAGASFGIGMVMGPPAPPKAEVKVEDEKIFMPTGPLVLPVVTVDGDLSGYGNFEVQLEIKKRDEAELKPRMPLLLHAINLRAYRTPMAAGKQKILPDLNQLSAVVMESATAAWGKGKVLRAVVISARPM